MQLCGSCDVGSIPTRGTKQKNHRQVVFLNVSYLTEILRIAATARDLMRAAAFFLMKSVFAALSAAWKIVGRRASASFTFFALINFSNCLRVESIALLRRRLFTFFRFDARNAFFADDVIGICLYVE
jgi:hypothetical protein